MGVLAALAAACGPGDGSQSSAPHDVVVDLGGEVAVLKDLNSHPRIVGSRPAGAENADAYRLDSPRQLASGEVVGIRDGGVVAIEPSTPGRAVLLGQASAWFPSAEGKQLWAVTEESADTACAGQELPQSVSARFTVSKYETSGHPSRTKLTLPCGMRPVADTSRGLLAERTTGDTGGTGTGGRAVTNIVVLNARADTATKTIATNASVVAAASNRVIWRDDACNTGSCTHSYDVDKPKSDHAPSCKGGDTVGVGTLDPSGRWYASVLRSNHLAVLDLDQGTCHEVDALPTTNAGDLDQTFAVAWSGQNLMLLDQRSGVLASMDASSTEIDKRSKPLSVVNQAQIWGAGTT
ncbi:hypothetical protein [Streptomyces sp. MUSC 125]|uniref:hypothetical protein n=1 Tax=Streptomyces sp. MUSC 125 TaxID=1428624 RepID=UPI00131EA2DD|nr:hypothetical protein [Streptomyces sp. MUSC 125]